MKKPLTDEDLLERAAIDGRVAFATAAFALAAGLVALLDRVGVPERLVAALGPTAALTGLATVGLLLRSMRISRFYAGGRAVPAAYAGLAIASLAAGLFMPFVLPVPGGTSLTGLLVGFGAGLVVAALVAGPLVRKTGAFSVPDLLAARFPNMALRLGSVVVVAAVAVLVTLAGYEVAVRTLVLASGVERATASFLVGLVLVMIVVPGGLAGVVWSATGAAGILLAGLGLPLAVLLAHGDSVPLPILGDRDLWERARTLMIDWHAAGASAPVHMSALLIVAIAVGVGVLAPLLSPAITCRDAGTAQRAGFAALVWSLVIVAGVAATMAIAALALDQGLVGLRPEGLASFVYIASGKGLVTICGQAVADSGGGTDGLRRRAGLRRPAARARYRGERRISDPRPAAIAPVRGRLLGSRRSRRRRRRAGSGRRRDRGARHRARPRCLLPRARYPGADEPAARRHARHHARGDRGHGCPSRFPSDRSAERDRPRARLLGRGDRAAADPLPVAAGLECRCDDCSACGAGERRSRDRRRRQCGAVDRTTGGERRHRLRDRHARRLYGQSSAPQRSGEPGRRFRARPVCMARTTCCTPTRGREIRLYTAERRWEDGIWPRRT